MPSSTKMEEAWWPVVRDISSWAASSVDLRFGHIKAPYATGKSRFIPRAIWSSVTEKNRETLVCHALPTSETFPMSIIMRSGDPAGVWHKSLINQCNARPEPPTEAMIIDSFSKITSMLRQGIRDPRRAKASGKPLIIIIDLNLQCPADLALLLVAILVWARPAGLEPRSSSVTVLTMAAWDPPSYLRNIYASYYPDGQIPIVEFMLPTSREVREVAIQSTKEDDIAAKIKAAIASRPKSEKHCVFVFDQAMQTPALAESLDAISFGITEPLGVSDPQRLELEYQYIQKMLQGGNTGNKVTIVKMQQGGWWHLRGQISGLENIYLIIGEIRTRAVFDAETHQTVSIMTGLSLEEREDVLAWTSRIRPGLCNVQCYLLDSEASTAAEYLARGSPHRRWDVANYQMLGFLASLGRFERWLPDVMPIINSFISRDASAVMIRRGAGLKLFSLQANASGSSVIKLTMPPEQQLLFSHMLPLCDYDARLALLLSLPSASPMITTIKVDLAAILATLAKSELETIITWRNPKKPPGFYDLVRVCSGPVYFLAGTGSTWLVLGLWQNCRSNAENSVPNLEAVIGSGANAELNKSFENPEEGYNFVAENTLLSFSRRTAMRAVLAKFKVDVLTSLRHGDRLMEMETVDMRRQILQCFIYSLCGINLGDKDGRCVFSLASTGMMMQAVPRMLHPPTQLKLSTEGKVYGIPMIPLVRSWDGSITALNDWAAIPLEDVDDWMKRNSCKDLRGFLWSNPRGFNIDEIKHN